MKRLHSLQRTSEPSTSRPFFPKTLFSRDSVPFFQADRSGFIQRQTETSSQPEEKEEENAVQGKPQETSIQRMCAECEQEQREKPVMQTKLSVGEAGDQYEQEADRVAEQVVDHLQTAKAPSIQTKFEHALPTITPLVMRQGEGTAAASPHVEQGIRRTRGSGDAMAPAIRRSMEQAFGADFSGVRIHADGEADALNRSLKARAFTSGREVYFKSGEYHPESQSGQQILAHELTHVIQQSGATGTHAVDSQGRYRLLQSTPDQAETEQGAQQRICGPDITDSLVTMLGTVEPWFRPLSGFQKARSCMALGPLAFLAGVNPAMGWDTRQLFLPNTSWLDSYFLSHSCGSPRDAGCAADPTRHLCETYGSCGNSVVVGGKCMLAGTANYALYGKMCRLCHDYTGRWNRWDMRATIGAWKAIDGDDSTPPKEVASAAYDRTFPAVPAAAENRVSCSGRCGQTHSGAFDFIWEPYRPR